jgi:AcrR family transcriptional regulator
VGNNRCALYADGVSRDEKIRSAAAELFYRRGFAAVGVDEIGKAAGVTGPAIYRHFNGKDEILSTLFDEGMDEIIRVTGGTFDDPYEELAHLIREHSRYVRSDTHVASVWIREDRSLVDPYRKRYLRRARKYFERWHDCVEACYPEAAESEIERSVYAVLGMLNSIPSWPPAAQKAGDVPEFMVQLGLGAFASLERPALRREAS